MKREQFVAALRTTLMQLDDYHNLRHSPLLPLLCKDTDGANPVALQRYLIDAINALKGKPGAAHAYELLHYRYVEHLSQADVAFQLGVSVRQLRRDQNNALELLAEQLWTQLAPTAEPLSQVLPPMTDNGALHAEVDWVRRQYAGASSQLTQEVQKALAEAAVLAATYRVAFQPDYPAQVSPAAIPPLVLRHTLLTILSVLIPAVANQPLTITLTERQRTLTLAITLPPSANGVDIEAHCHRALGVAGQLLTPFHGTIGLQKRSTSHQIELTLPKVGGIPILVVDDNPDICQLLQRYAAHSRFQIIPVIDARQTVALAQLHAAQAIVIDVMMPDLDGWDLLAQLRHHPATQTLPIAVCTILPQQELARLLGATHFLQKPISQETFLATVTALIASTATTPG